MSTPPTTGMRYSRSARTGAGAARGRVRVDVTMSVRGNCDFAHESLVARTDRTMSRSFLTADLVDDFTQVGDQSARACASVGSGRREERTRVHSGRPGDVAEARARRSASPVPTNAIPSGLRFHWAGRKETKIPAGSLR